MIRTKDDVIQESLKFISGLNKDYDIQVGEPLRDIVIDVPAIEFEKCYYLLDFYSKSQSIDGLLSMNDKYRQELASKLNIGRNIIDEVIRSNIDKFVDNFNLYRKGAVAATGVVRFYYRDNNKSYVIPANIMVSTIESGNIDAVSFRTKVEVAQIPVYANNEYYIDSVVEAIEEGSKGNVSVGMVKKLISYVEGVYNVRNIDSMVGGIDEETDRELLLRCSRVFVGRERGVKGGYENSLLVVEGVQDVLVVDWKDLKYKRGIGSCDVFVIGRRESSAEQVIRGVGKEIILGKQPVISISSVKMNNLDVDYDFIEDKNLYSGSIKAKSKILLAVEPFDNEVKVDYIYNSIIEDLQLIIDDDMNRVLGVDALVREGIRKEIKIELRVYVFGGYVLGEVQNNISIALHKFVDGLLLGEALDVSDILQVVINVDGVDRLDTIVSKIDNEKISDIAGGRKLLSAREYFRVGQILYV